jgi:hypothetical protein
MARVASRLRAASSADWAFAGADNESASKKASAPRIMVIIEVVSLPSAIWKASSVELSHAPKASPKSIGEQPEAD